MSFIEFKNVSKIYKMGEVEIKALDDISFEIDKGEFVVVLGNSGAGKTVLQSNIWDGDSLTYSSSNNIIRALIRIRLNWGRRS